jgi:hypothetical protein
VSSSHVKYPYKKKPGKTKAFFICLLIASFLWLAHSLNTVYTYTFKIPVTFKNIPRHKKPLVQIPEIISVDVKASGLKLAFMLLNKSRRHLEIDFNTLKSVNRNQNYILSSSHINFKKAFKFETQVKQISPDTLYFSEKTGYQKNVPVKVPLYIKCQEGYGFKKPVITPAFVTVWGDTNIIENLDTLYTRALTLNNLNVNVNTNMEFIKPDPEVYTAINEVNVFIEVAKLVEQTITLPVIDIRRKADDQINIYPSRVRVRFTSVQNSFNEEDTTLFRAMIDSDKINKSTQKCPVFLGTVPGDVTIMAIEPGEVEILILKR